MTREELKKVRRASASSLDLLLFICHLLLNCFQNPLESTWLFCVKVLVSRYPGLSVVSDRLLDIYCQLTGDKHSDPNTNDLLSPDDDDPPAEDRVSPLEGRALSLRSDSALPDGWRPLTWNPILCPSSQVNPEQQTHPGDSTFLLPDYNPDFSSFVDVFCAGTFWSGASASVSALTTHPQLQHSTSSWRFVPFLHLTDRNSFMF